MKVTFTFPDGMELKDMSKTISDFIRVWNASEKSITGKKKSSVKWIVTAMDYSPAPRGGGKEEGK